MTKSEMVDLIKNCILTSGCTRCLYNKWDTDDTEHRKCKIYMLNDILDLLESMDDDPDPKEHPDKKPAPDYQEPAGGKAERVFPAHNLNFSDYIDLSKIVYIEEMDTNRDPFRVFLDGKEAPLLISHEDTGLALVEAWKRYLEEHNV